MPYFALALLVEAGVLCIWNTDPVHCGEPDSEGRQPDPLWCDVHRLAAQLKCSLDLCFDFATIGKFNICLPYAKHTPLNNPSIFNIYLQENVYSLLYVLYKLAFFKMNFNILSRSIFPAAYCHAVHYQAENFKT